MDCKLFIKFIKDLAVPGTARSPYCDHGIFIGTKVSILHMMYGTLDNEVRSPIFPSTGQLVH
jgi:hypothetical protein